MVSTLELSHPVFIVGMNGSGTTMLISCLDSHSQLYGFERETKILPYFIQSAKKYGDLSDDDNFYRLWEYFLSFSFFKYVNMGNDVPMPKNWKDVPRTPAGIIDQTFLYFAQQQQKNRWIEKTPMHAQHIPLLAKCFPTAKFIHIIRDGRACASSFHRRWKYTPELTIYRWKNIVSEAQRQGELLPNRYFELRYEDLTSNPGIWLDKICNFLQIPYEPSIINLRQVKKHSGSSDTKITKHSDYWRDYFGEDALGQLEIISGKVLHQLGYSTLHPTSDHNPLKLQLQYWSFKDNIRKIYSALHDEFTYKNNGKWDSFSGRVINAIRQRITNRM